MVLLAGEPGIGKARLAEELAAQATVRGAVVLWGRCWEGRGARVLAAGPVVHGYLESGDPAALRRDIGAGAADIAQVVPAVRDNLPDLPALQGGSWRDDRQVINGIIWRTRAGAPWRDLPERRTPCQTC